MAAPLYKTESGRLFHAGQIVVSAVGLPARGKTAVSRSLERYMKWLGVPVRVFSLGDYRRAKLGSGKQLPPDYFSTGARSESTEALRREVRLQVERQIVEWLANGGQVAIYDANNATKKERYELRDHFEPLGAQLFFIENVCTDPKVVEANVRAVKLSGPDYKGWEPARAMADYLERIRDHEQWYETIESPSFPYVKIINGGDRIVINNIAGYLQSRIVFFLMNIHHRYRTIWFARSGRSEIEHSYKADSSLSEEGEEYAQQLFEFIMRRRREERDRLRLEGQSERPFAIWSSARRRCVETCAPFRDAGYRVKELSQLIEINPGVIDGMTPAEIAVAYPDEYKRAQAEPYKHRYPRGESYHDLSVRLESCIFELEREKGDLLLVGHASVLRCLFAYLRGLAPAEIPAVDLRRGDVIEITPSSYGVSSKTHHVALAEGLHPPEVDAFAYGSPATPSAILSALKLNDTPKTSKSALSETL